MVRRSWSINGRFLTQPITGVQRYAREIVNSLDGLVATGHELANGLDLELIVPRGTDSLLQLQSIRLREVGTLKGHLWEQIVLPASVRHGLLSLCNTGPLALRNHIVCIHDASTRSFPSSYSFHF